MRTIDADALKQNFPKDADWEYPVNTNGHVCEIIDSQPTIERKKGKWIKKMRITETEKYTSYDPEWYCACCGTKYDSHVAKMVNFCYVCGDDMRGEE